MFFMGTPFILSPLDDTSKTSLNIASIYRLNKSDERTHRCQKLS